MRLFRGLKSALLFAFLAFAPSLIAAQSPVPSNAPYKNPATPVEQRVADLLSRMTLEEKATMLSGSGWMESAPIDAAGHSRHQDGRRAAGRAFLGGQFGDYQRGQRSR